MINKTQLFHGDCLKILSASNIDFENSCFVSDPPFNIGYHYNEYQDRMDETEYFNFLASVFNNNKQVIIHYPEALYKYASIVNMFPEKVVSWVYNSNTAKQHRDIAFFGIKPNFRKIGQDYKNPSDRRIAKRIQEGKKARLYDWWEINQVKNVSSDKTEHPCQMPIEVMRRIVGILPEQFTIIDPFMGSGTTGVACVEMGRSFIGIEMDAKYFNIAKQRIDNTPQVASR